MNNHSSFCSYIIYKSFGSLGYGPDYIRLKLRFEVTNGVTQL